VREPDPAPRRGRGSSCVWGRRGGTGGQPKAGGGVKGGTFGQGYRPVTFIWGLLESPLYVNSLYALVPCKPGYVSYH